MTTRKSRRVPFIVSFGGEELYLDRDLERAKNTKNRHVIVLDGNDISEDELVSLCEARSFDQTNRIIVLDNAQKFKSTKGPLKSYIADKDPEDVTTVLVAIVRAPAPGTLWGAAISKGRSAEHPKFKPWEKGKTLARIGREAARLKLKLDPGIAELLMTVTGVNLRQIASELRKLVHIVGEPKVVKRDHVAKVITHVYPATPYDVSQAAAHRNSRKAMTLFSFLYKHMGVGACISVTTSLQRLVEKLIIARQLLDQGEDPDVIAVRFNMKPYPFKKNLLPMVRRHTVSHLQEQMQILCRLETKVKGASRSKRTQVELAILSLAA